METLAKNRADLHASRTLRGMELAWEDRGDGRWIELEGELDHPACLEIRESFQRVVRSAGGNVTVAMDKVDFMSSMAVGIVLKARELLHGDGRVLRLSGLRSPARRALTLMQLTDVFEEV